MKVKRIFNTGGPVNPAPRAQNPAVIIPGNVPHQRSLQSDVTQMTPRHQVRIGAKVTPAQYHNGTRLAPAGSGRPINAAVNPTTRHESSVLSRTSSRGVNTNNPFTSLGSGTPNDKAKSVAGMPNVYNVGGQGGHSSILVNITKIKNQTAHNNTIAKLRANNGVSSKSDPSKQTLTPKAPTKIHAGFHHVGYAKN